MELLRGLMALSDMQIAEMASNIITAYTSLKRQHYSKTMSGPTVSEALNSLCLHLQVNPFHIPWDSHWYLGDQR